MWGYFAGIPAAFVALVWGLRFLPEYFHNWQLGWGAAGCLALIVYGFFRGIDVLNDQRLDNPEPFDVYKNAPEVFGTIRELLKEAQYGPWTWSLRSEDTEAMRIVAVFSFTEISQGFFEHGRIQLNRLIMLEMAFEPTELPGLIKPEEKTQGTKIRMAWVVDSPANRYKVNEIIRETTAEIQHSLGLKEIERKKPRHPLIPPEWLIATTVTLFLLGGYNHDDFEKQMELRKAQQEQIQQTQQAERNRLQRERDEQIAAYKRKQEDQQKQWEQQQQSGGSSAGGSPYNPLGIGGGNTSNGGFTPILTPPDNNQPGGTSSNNAPIWGTPSWQSSTPSLGGAGNPNVDQSNNTSSGSISNGQRWRAGGAP